MRLDGVVTVVDAYHVTQHLDEDKGEGIVNEAVEQIAYADRILLNKVDLVRNRGGEMEGGGGGAWTGPMGLGHNNRPQANRNVPLCSLLAGHPRSAEGAGGAAARNQRVGGSAARDQGGG